MSLPASDLEALLPAWAGLIRQLRNTLLNQSPPPSLSLHAPSSASTLKLALQSLFREDNGALPNAVFVDCLLFYNPKAIYDTILNGLAGWKAEYSSTLEGAQNWDGRVDEIQDVLVEDESEEQPAKRRRLQWDTTELPAAQRAKGALAGHMDDSLAAFLEGLHAIYRLAAEIEPAGSSTPRYIVFHHAERLVNISQAAATAGATALEDSVNEGTFFAALTRLSELVSVTSMELSLYSHLLNQTGKPIVPIFVSELDYFKYRPRMGRALEPGPAALFHVPNLQKDGKISNALNMLLAVLTWHFRRGQSAFS